jgi:hypothetical protein
MADGLLNKASIILTPTGYKAGTLYNVAPVVEPYEDFDFARASVASRVNSSGLVEMVGRTLSSELMPSVATIVNLLGGSITQISSNSYSSTSDGTTGSSLRPKFDFNTTSGKTYKLVITPTGAITGTLNFDFYDGSSYLFQNYDFTTTKEIYFTDNGSVFGGFDGTKTYSIASFTISVKEVIDTNNIPRISYDSNGENGHILLEPSSTNLLSYSEDFSEWYAGESVVVVNQLTSPNGEITADKLNAFNATNQQYVKLTPTVSTGSACTLSCFAKKGEVNYIALVGLNPFTTSFFDLNNGVLLGNTATSSSIEDFGNGWYRCTSTFDADTTSKYSAIYLSYNGTSISNGTNISNGEGVYIWGAQLEQLPYATSYIPSLTGSTVTRATETLTGSGNSTLINSTEGVLYAEIAALVNGGANRYISLSDNTTSNRLNIIFSSNTNRLTISGTGNIGSFTNVNFFSYTQNVYNKIAIKYSSSGVKLFVNGSLEGSNSDNVSWTSNTLTTLDFTLWNQSTAPFEGKVKALAVFNEALSDSELTQLTT